jgi:hypothetical protein
MKKDQAALNFHDLLNAATSIKSALYLALMKKESAQKKEINNKEKKASQETEAAINICLKRCDQLIKSIQDLQNLPPGRWPK